VSIFKSNKTNEAVSNVVRIAVPTSVGFRDPAELVMLHEWDVYRSIHDKLFVSEGVLGGFEPVLARKWSIDEETGVLSIFLKPELRFSDGTPITANDVKFSLYRKLKLTGLKESTFASCLGIGQEELLNLTEEDFVQVKVETDLHLRISLANCGPGILEELSGTNYAVVKRDTVGQDLRLLPDSAVSGMHTFKIDGPRIRLKPNRNNWRFANSPEHDYELILSPDFHGSEVDFEVVSRADKVVEYRKRGLIEKKGILTATIFLSSSGNLDEYRILEKFVSQIDRAALEDSLGNDLYQYAKDFFPVGYGCENNEENGASEGKTPIPENINFIIKYRKGSQLYDGIAQGLLKSIPPGLAERTTFYSTDEHFEKRDADVVLYLGGQHLSKRPSEVIRLAVQTFKTIPDPERKIETLLVNLSKANSESEGDALNRLCAQFRRYHHIPLLHARQIAFASHEKYLEMFSEVLGNVHYDRIAK
jgi:hypothetical protein